MSHYCLQTKYRQEANVEMRLSELGYDAYNPLAIRDRRLGRWTNHITESLFPTYLFFWAIEGETDFHPITKVSGVLRILRSNRASPDGERYQAPTIVPETLISTLKALENAQGIHSMHTHDYKSGDKVRIISGPFAQELAEISQLDGERRAIVLLNILGRPVTVKVDYKSIQPVA